MQWPRRDGGHRPESLFLAADRCDPTMVYGLSLLLAIAALTLLVVFAALRGSPSTVVGFSIFGASLVLFYVMRWIYAYTHDEDPRKPSRQKLDHVMIYVVTAATYTPVALLLPSRAWGWVVFGVVWGLVSLAAILRWTEWLDKRWVTLGLYGMLLILDTVAFRAIHELLSPWAFFWLTIGGLCYVTETVLVVFRPEALLVRPFKSHETIAFPFMIAGSFCHFWAMLRWVL